MPSSTSSPSDFITVVGHHVSSFRPLGKGAIRELGENDYRMLFELTSRELRPDSEKALWLLRLITKAELRVEVCGGRGSLVSQSLPVFKAGLQLAVQPEITEAGFGERDVVAHGLQALLPIMTNAATLFCIANGLEPHTPSYIRTTSNVLSGLERGPQLRRNYTGLRINDTF